VDISRRKLLLTPVAIAAALLVGGVAAFAATASDPGVSPTSVLLGATAPLTGPAAAYASAAQGAEAYFRYQNGRGGVAGRQIAYEVLDDAFDPVQTVRATRELVEQDRVFALVSPVGTQPGLATRDYLKEQGVPQLFVASGAAYFGDDASDYPGTIGFQPSFLSEGVVYGRYLARTRPGARVAVLFQNDELGKDMLAGLRRGLARSKVKVVAAQPYEVTATDVGPQVAKLRSSGADVLALFATRPFAVQGYAAAGKLAWKPKLTLVSFAAAAAGAMTQASEGGQGKLAAGAVSIAFVKDPTDPKWRTDTTMKLYRSIMKRFAPAANATDAYNVYGMAVAWTTVELLRKLGKTPTRAALVKAVSDMNVSKNPFLLPGIAIKTGVDDHFPVEQMVLQRWSNGGWRTFGGIWSQPS
jgi:branched-chain amino acid transport system substrate-binding protein